MPELVAPTARLRESWLEAREEWGAEAEQAGSGLRVDDDVATRAGFNAWLARLRREGDTSLVPQPGRVHASYWWVAEGGTYLGAISLRHALTDFLLQAGGHIGYGVRPSARRRGVATWALGAVLPPAREVGLDRVLVTCDEDNLASARTVEHNGGVLEDVRDIGLGRKRRYWITLAGEGAGTG